MEPRIHVLTLAVDDLERALEFSRRLAIGRRASGEFSLGHIGS